MVQNSNRQGILENQFGKDSEEISENKTESIPSYQNNFPKFPFVTMPNMQPIMYQNNLYMYPQYACTPFNKKEFKNFPNYTNNINYGKKDM